MAKLYPVGIQDFKKIRTGGYVYVHCFIVWLVPVVIISSAVRAALVRV